MRCALDGYYLIHKRSNHFFLNKEGNPGLAHSYTENKYR